MRTKHTALAALLLCSTAHAHAYTLDETLDAIRHVESGDYGDDAPRGDGGKARGPYQIHKAYWQDSGIPGDWSDCDREPYARRVVVAYMRRYCPEALEKPDNVNAERIARTHNGGPRGPQKAATARYWRRVQRVLDGEKD